MKAIRCFVTLALLLAPGGGMLSSAWAGDYWGGYHFGRYRYPFSHYAYRSGNIPAPPYYAIHPPVYYGTRVGMPYGNSPLTRPPRPVVRVSPRLEKPRPVEGVMIENPFVKNKGKKKAKGSKKRSVSSKPKTIINPYVIHDESKKTEQLAAH
jgi:hypothetical protein